MGNPLECLRLGAFPPTRDQVANPSLFIDPFPPRDPRVTLGKTSGNIPQLTLTPQVNYHQVITLGCALSGTHPLP
jgi:hypothetical protein